MIYKKYFKYQKTYQKHYLFNYIYFIFLCFYGEFCHLKIRYRNNIKKDKK